MIYNSIKQLINYGVKNFLIEEEDIILVRNELMNLLNLQLTLKIQLSLQQLLDIYQLENQLKIQL